MFICKSCGRHFEEMEAKNYDRSTGTWEESCPFCGGEEFTDAAYCGACGEWREESEVVNGFCRECVEKHANDYETVKAYGKAESDPVIINGLFAWAFTPAEIEEILERELKNSGNADKYAHTFATDDTDDFTNWLNERSEA